MNLVLQAMGIIASSFFMWRLVVNDNHRAARDEEVKLRGRIRYFLGDGLKAPGLAQIAGRELANRFPKHLHLVLEVCEEIWVELRHTGTTVMSAREFLQYNKDHGPGPWRDVKYE